MIKNSNSILQELLNENSWDKFSPIMEELSVWEHYPVFREILRRLNRSALYKSPIHGLGHIERTMLFGALIARDENLSRRETELLLLACSYHDVGRVNDVWDTSHGARSAEQLEKLTGCRGEELCVLRAAVTAHSMPDAYLEEIVEEICPLAVERGRRMGLMLKDADGLDRVRINDLDPIFLRMKGSARYEIFAYYLFEKYRVVEMNRKQ